MLKTTLKILVAIAILFIIVYNFLLSDFNPIFKNVEFVHLRNSIKATQNEDLKSILHIYRKIHQTVKENRCACEMANSNIGPYRHGFSLTKKLYLLKLEREFTQDECLKFELLNTDFAYGNIGIKNAAKTYFDKTVEQLNEEEKIIFVVMLENPMLYNPLRRKEKVMKKVLIYKKILHSKNGW
jgi:hypothetical protein